MPVTTTTTTPAPDTNASPTQAGDGEHIAARRARQGFMDRPVLWVLLISMTLLVIAFGVAFMSNWSPEASMEQGASRVNDPASAELFDAPAPAAKVIESN